MRRIFVDKTCVGDTKIRVTSAFQLRHLRNVLRMKAGDRLTVASSDGFIYECSIANIDGNKQLMELLIEDKQAPAHEADARITLFQSVPKSGKLETIIQKSVELGVHEIVPFYSDRSVPKQAADQSKTDKSKTDKSERYNKLAQEAAEQSIRSYVPIVRQTITSDLMTDAISGFDLIVMPYENEERISIKHVLKTYARSIDPGKPLGDIALIIGPEGGFSERELLLYASCGAEVCTLGKNILRTETAGPAAIAMILYELEL